MFRKILIFITGFFGATKSELIGFLPLLVLSFLLVVAGILLPKFLKNTKSETGQDLEKFLAWRKTVEENISTVDNSKLISEQSKSFPFDPNTVSKENLISLGFKPWIASRMINYRNSGAQFKAKADLFKIYGIDSAKVKELWNFIAIPAQIVEKPKPSGRTSKPEVSTPEKEIPVAIMEYPDINSTSAEELQRIRGIGPAYGNRIIKYRDLLGGYNSYDQLHEVYGLKPQLVDSVKKYFTLDTTGLVKIDINNIGYKNLAKHPYIDFKLAKAIEAYRIQHGSFNDPIALKKIKIFHDSIFQRILPYIKIQ